jgi:hypothetical protein
MPLFRYLTLAIIILASLTFLGALAYTLLWLLRKHMHRANGVGRASNRLTGEKLAFELVGTITLFVGALNALVNLFMGLSGAKVTPADDGREAIRSFYEHIQEGDFERAWGLIHSGRKKELANKGMRDADDLAKAYETVQDYRNIQVVFDVAESSTSRLYEVSFDLRDRFPRSTLFQYLNEPLRKALEDGLMDRNKAFALIVNDLRLNYELPDSAVVQVEQYIGNAQLSEAMGPRILSDFARYAKLRRTFRGPEVGVWTHYIQHLKLQNDDGWKIRSGLFPSVLEASYPWYSEGPLGSRSRQRP